MSPLLQEQILIGGLKSAALERGLPASPATSLALMILILQEQAVMLTRHDCFKPISSHQAEDTSTADSKPATVLAAQ